MIQYQATIVDAKQLTLPVTVNDVRHELVIYVDTETLNARVKPTYKQ